MKNTVLSLALALGITAVALQPASACVMRAPTVLTDVEFADAVVVGRIANYKIVLDPQYPMHQRLYARIFEGGGGGSIRDYARFDILVDEVLKGKVTRKLTVTWDASTFAEPANMPSGPYVIALRDPSSKAPPLRGPSATLFRSPEPGKLTVMHPPCAGGFVFESTSEEAIEIRRLFRH